MSKELFTEVVHLVRALSYYPLDSCNLARELLTDFWAELFVSIRPVQACGGNGTAIQHSSHGGNGLRCKGAGLGRAKSDGLSGLWCDWGSGLRYLARGWVRVTSGLHGDMHLAARNGAFLMCR
jgi:hypothetical protein